MTDRHAGYIVTLADDVREDDAEHVINALRMVRGVLSVKPVVADIELHMATERAKQDITSRFHEILWSKKDSP